MLRQINPINDKKIKRFSMCEKITNSQEFIESRVKEQSPTIKNALANDPDNERAPFMRIRTNRQFILPNKIMLNLLEEDSNMEKPPLPIRLRAKPLNSEQIENKRYSMFEKQTINRSNNDLKNDDSRTIEPNFEKPKSVRERVKMFDVYNNNN